MSDKEEWKDLFGEDDEEETEEKVEETVAENSIVKEIPGLGGGRGLFAARDLSAGILIVAEIPIVVWDDPNALDDPDILADVVERVCSDSDASSVCRHLHPRSLSEADEKEKSRVDDIWGRDVLQRISLKTSMPIDEVIRIILVLQHNGFGSGLYKHLSMVNHSCSPNCIKFNPSNSSGWASEIWTTRPVSVGEELTICYCDSLELSTFSMQSFLKDHHRFQCCCRRCNISDISHEQGGRELREVTETQGGGDAEQIQAQLVDMGKELGYADLDGFENAVRKSSKIMKKSEALAVLLARPTLSTIAPTDRVLLLSRSHKVAADAAAACLEAIERIGSKSIKSALIRKTVLSFAHNSIKLRDCQEQYLGNEHPDLIRTYFDIAEGIRCILNDWEALSSIIAETEYATTWAADETQTRAALANFKEKGDILKSKYNTRKNFPKASKVLKHPGDYYYS